MITFGNLNPSQVHVSTFDPSSAKPTKHLSSQVGMSDSISRAGSEWSRSLTDGLGLVQSFSDFCGESVIDSLGITDSIGSTVDRPSSVTDTLGVTDSFVWAGTADDGSSPETEATFDSDAKKGMVVYVPSSGHADLAQADAIGTTRAVGLVVADVSSGDLGSYVTEGPLTLADWTLVTGSATLTPGAYYYLSAAAAGKLSSSAPTTTGHFVVAVGRALSTTQLDIEISQPILM